MKKLPARLQNLFNTIHVWEQNTVPQKSDTIHGVIEDPMVRKLWCLQELLQSQLLLLEERSAELEDLLDQSDENWNELDQLEEERIPALERLLKTVGLVLAKLITEVYPAVGRQYYYICEGWQLATANIVASKPDGIVPLNEAHNRMSRYN